MAVASGIPIVTRSRRTRGTDLTAGAVLRPRKWDEP